MRDRRARVERAIGRAAWRHLHALRHARLRVAELRATHCSAKLLVSPFPVRGTDTRIKFQRHFPLPEGALHKNPGLHKKSWGCTKSPRGEGDLTGADRSVARSALTTRRRTAGPRGARRSPRYSESGESDAASRYSRPIRSRWRARHQ